MNTNYKILNITNGECFNKYFSSTFDGVAIPFDECMMDGDTVSDIYSKEFVSLRSSSLNVSFKEYREKMSVYDALIGDAYSELRLWFGKDTFCQINLLTLLAYLEQIKFDGKVILNYIDDETFDKIETGIEVELGIYKKLYNEILILRQKPSALGVLDAMAIELYFDYHSEDGALASLVKANTSKDESTIIRLLLKASKDYGLSDIQAKMLMKKHKSNSNI